MEISAQENVSDAILRVRDAFEQFECQSAVLTSSYEALSQQLARSDRQLKLKNRALSEKVDELQRMSSRLHCILESLTDGVLVVDNKLVVERSNPAVQSLVELKREEIEGKLYEDIMNGLGNVERLRTAIAEGRSFPDEERCSASGQRGHVAVVASVAPILGADGVVVGAVEVLKDVTEMHQLQERVHSQKRMAALGEMAASVAHEIRNPLGTIQGFARLLKRDLAEHPEHSRLASRIVEGTQNLNYVICNLLTYARPMALTIEDFSAQQLFEGTIELVMDRATRAGVEVVTADPRVTSADRPHMQVGYAALRASGDVRQLRQVLVNLALNAVDACAPGGRVTLSAAQCGRSVVFSVTDTGCGIPEADVQRIFDPFFTRKRGGTGLGLSLCHKIVSAHGGEISVAGEAGKGARFDVVLPREIGGRRLGSRQPRDRREQ